MHIIIDQKMFVHFLNGFLRTFSSVSKIYKWLRYGYKQTVILMEIFFPFVVRSALFLKKEK